MPSLTGSALLVAGANGSIGTQLVRDALERADKVHATARDPRTWDDSRIVARPSDITDHDSILGAARAAPNVAVLVNIAGAIPFRPDSHSPRGLRRHATGL